MRRSRYVHILFTVLLVFLATTCVTAAEITVDPTTSFCFSSDDFTASETADGVFITAVPSRNIATVRYGERVLKAGDALTTEALDMLTLETSCVTTQSVSIEYCTVSDGKVTGTDTLKMSIRPKSNEPPTAQDSHFETYKNISNDGALKATDPEGGELTFALVDAPKRGEVELHENGTFVYTPRKNKVGKDSFTFTATDNAGNTSEPAKVTIEILKVTSKPTYADMTNDPSSFEAHWLRENDIFSGSVIGGKLCFEPAEEVTRGEFLVMVMKLVGADQTLTVSTSGFADETSTPAWMQPYIATALSNGMISGASTDDGVVFRPADAMTKAEAAVMLQNILELPTRDTTPVFASTEDETVPVWASEAYHALLDAGIELTFADQEDTLTRKDAATALYGIQGILDNKAVAELYWLE
ncbi:MAG: S-layer homology domain-containing protein [Oscillospiraceae bacterium]|nr:S-layer homology domain-containing protein [Oscillospiraceae bacterium]